MLISPKFLKNNIANTKSKVPLSSHKSPKMCLVCYSHFLYLYKIIVIQSFALRYKESPPSVFTLAPDDKYIKYTMDKAMYLVDETGLAQYNTLKEFLFGTINLIRNLLPP